MEQYEAIKRQATWGNVGPTIGFGTVCGLGGGIFGSLWALFRPYPRVGLYSFLAFSQYFAYGTAFHGSRAYYLHTRPFSDNKSPSPPSHFDLLTCSTLGGATSGALINAGLRQRFILSGMLQLSLYGYLGQRAWMWVDERHSRQVERDAERKRRLESGEREEGFVEKMASMAGMRKMSDEEYEGVLGERSLELEAEIALVDEQIDALRREEKGEKGEEDAREVKR